MKIYILRRILLFSCLFLQFELGAQTYILGEGPSTIFTCGGTILDPGGTGDYENDLDVTQTICPQNAGESLQLSFISFGTEACCDKLTIYEGGSTNGPILGVLAGNIQPGTFISSTFGNGCLTLNFEADISIVGSGFEASISCVPSPASITLGEGNDTLYGCSFVITDPGGAENYGPNENVVQTFCSGSGECVRFDLQFLNMEAELDMLNIYDGSGIGSQLIASFSDNFGNPVPVQSSIASGGCLTLQFTSNETTQLAGFRASIICTPCEIAPIIFGQDEVITLCNGVILDPGGYTDYPLNSNATQTICSDNGECVKLIITEFSTESSVDVLRIYDGPDTSGDIIGILSGTPFVAPGPFSSSTESDGCITMEFTSNASFNMPGFEISVSCDSCSLPLEIPTGFCQDALPFCSSEGLYFPAAINTQSEFGLGIACLGSTPNPAWYYLRIGESGNLDLQITANTDIDFICWGPFSEEEWISGVCSTVLNSDWASNAENVVDCSYSATNNEDFDINNAVEGEYYIVLITNYSNQNQNIYFTQDGGSGSTDCIFFCDISLQAAVSTCDTVSNTYSVSGLVNLFEPPMNGTLTIENSSGGILSYSAPFPDTLSFTFEGLSSNGQQQSVQAAFSEAAFCNATLLYTSPPTCSQCAVFATVPEIACEGAPTQLSATFFEGAQYTWAGPNGFTSNEQNPVISNLDTLSEGTYLVTMTNQENDCSSMSSVNLLATPSPEIETIPDFSVCANTVAFLGLGNNSSYTYAWEPAAFVDNPTAPTVEASIQNFTNTPLSQLFTVVVSYLGCSVTETVTGTFLPVIPQAGVSITIDGPFAYLESGADSILWYVIDYPIPFEENSDTFLIPFPNFTSEVYAAVINEFGCVTYSDTLLFDPVSIYGLDSFHLNIFPNPAESQISIEAPVSSNFTLRDASGRIVREGFLKEKSTQIQVSDLSEGVYIVEVANQLGKVNRRISILRN